MKFTIVSKNDDEEIRVDHVEGPDWATAYAAWIKENEQGFSWQYMQAAFKGHHKSLEVFK